jgi:hypothetical protein
LLDIIKTCVLIIVRTHLKEHKHDNFFGFDFEFCTIYYLIVSYAKILRFWKKKCFDWATMGADRIVQRSPMTKGNKNCFQHRAKRIFNCISYMTLLYLLKLRFPKFDLLIVTWMALCVDLGPKCQHLFCLVWEKRNRVRLSIILSGTIESSPLMGQSKVFFY